MEGYGNHHVDGRSSPRGKAVMILIYATQGALLSEGGQPTVFVFQIFNDSGQRMATEVGNETNEKMKE